MVIFQPYTHHGTPPASDQAFCRNIVLFLVGYRGSRKTKTLKGI